MKSVIVQGATVAKAIDEALVKAGMPVEFFIKILEEAQPGFLGFGSKKAKIALFFKKEQGRREGSLLSRGSYKDLFDNENLSAQSVELSVDKVVEKKETVAAPVAQHQRKAEVLEQPQSRKPVPAPQAAGPVQRKADTSTTQHQSPKGAPQAKHVERKAPAPQQEPQKPMVEKVVVQRPLNQRPLNQRPLKFNNPKPQEVAPVLPPVEVKIPQVAVTPVADDLQKAEGQVEASQNKRPRRRRRYGYRSKAPIQWGKSEEDTAESQASDERHDS